MHRAGEVYVSGVARLLWYRLVSQGLHWEISENAEKGIVINLGEVSDPVLGVFKPNVEDLEGITFYTSNASRTTVVLTLNDGKQQEILIKRNPKDATGRESVTIPVRKWELPPTPSDRFLEN